jgi:uncharacterized protein (TIGR02646 family)
MIFINLKNNPPNDPQWIAKANEITQLLLGEPDVTKRFAIIDNNSALWGKIKDHLLSLSYNKCWYSEAKESFSHYHVDHFRPKKHAYDLSHIDKGGYWWLAFDWKNYRISGSVGNSKKGDRFCVHSNKVSDSTGDINLEVIYFLDPTDEEDTLAVTFDENGEILPVNATETDWDYIRAKYTIDNLDLNYPGLTDNRKDLWTNIVLKIREIQNLMNDYNVSRSPLTKQKIHDKLLQLKDLVKPNAAFSATTKACLRNSGLDWAQRIAA